MLLLPVDDGLPLSNSKGGGREILILWANGARLGEADGLGGPGRLGEADGLGGPGRLGGAGGMGVAEAC